MADSRRLHCPLGRCTSALQWHCSHFIKLCVLHASVSACISPSVRPCIQDYMFPQYLQNLLMDFRQTFVIGASWDKDKLITFWGQKIRCQGHITTVEASSTRCRRRVRVSSIGSKSCWREPACLYTK